MTPTGAASRAKLFRHRPGLDGLRGLSVVAVLAFHGGFSWARGGYLGVSTFFTLSGFLIATLVLREREETGRLSLKGFWWRRARRLLPAGLLGLLLAIGYAAVWSDSVQGLRADVLALLAYVANWRFVFSERSYAELFSDPSPVQHYWSLAVEEQFYVVFPLLVVACAALAGRRFRAVLLSVIVVVSVASVVISIAVSGSGSTDRAYYGTDARAGEILLGVLAAVLMISTSCRQRSPAARPITTAVGVVAAGSMVVLWVTVDQAHDALHPWLLLVHAIAATGVIVAAVHTGPVASALSWGPLRWLGKVSYGIYVYHWPVFLALSPERTGWDPTPLFALRVAVTLALAAASYRWIERPILTGALPAIRGRRRPVMVAVGAVALVIVAAVAVPSQRGVIDFDAAVAALDTDRTEVVESAEIDGPTPVAMVGDSVALMSALGIDGWGQLSGRIRVVASSTQLGCPLVLDGLFDRGEGAQPAPEECDWPTTWPATSTTPVDAVVVHLGTWDIVDRTLPGASGTTRIGDPDFDVHLSGQLDAANRLLLDRADTVIWLTLPEPAPFANSHDPTSRERVARFNELVRDAASRTTDRIQIVDLAEWIEVHGPSDRTLRPDGVHFSEDSALQAGQWLGPAILRAIDDPDDFEINPHEVEAEPVP